MPGLPPNIGTVPVRLPNYQDPELPAAWEVNNQEWNEALYQRRPSTMDTIAAGIDMITSPLASLAINTTNFGASTVRSIASSAASVGSYVFTRGASRPATPKTSPFQNGNVPSRLSNFDNRSSSPEPGNLHFSGMDPLTPEGAVVFEPQNEDSEYTVIDIPPA